MAERDQPAHSLTRVLGQSEHVKDLVEECAEELSTVNLALKRELAEPAQSPGVEIALVKSEAVEIKVQVAFEELSIVTQELEVEVEDRRELDHQFEMSRKAAFHDVLTGLPNRALFNDRLEHGLAQARRHGGSLAVMFIDLDEFKNINDSYGHDVGDGVLHAIAGRLKENARSDDTVSRHGGDEFLYLLMETPDEKDIVMIARKIISAIQMPCSVRIRDTDIVASINASIGIAIFPKDGTTADALVKNADRAMYRAKQDRSGHSFAM